MTTLGRASLLGLGLTGALLAGACSSGYYDDGYNRDGYYSHRYQHSDYDRDGDRYRSSDSERVRVCDADGDDCRWEYRRR